MVTSAQVTVEVVGRGRWVLGHGAIIGRLWTADLHIADPRVSEAHALVSVREGRMVLLALRRRWTVEGVARTEVELRQGLEIELAPGTRLRVCEVRAPREALAVRLEGCPPQALLGACSVVRGAPWRIEPGQSSSAALWLWCDGHAWWAARPGCEGHAVEPGSVVPIGGGSTAAFESMALQGADATGAGEALLDGAPLRLVARYDSVEIGRIGGPSTFLGGRPARVLAELVAFGGPVGWEMVAREVWRHEADASALRRTWDTTLHRLRARLRSLGVREDLIVGAGHGLVTLSVVPGDQIEDRS